MCLDWVKNREQKQQNKITIRENNKQCLHSIKLLYTLDLTSTNSMQNATKHKHKHAFHALYQSIHK